ncbi:MAG: hypothetical protein C4558_06315 [Dehalococcoidia bacterium]|nr:MAG: hypothetical protein C4558_06315 [Dehalococcoidia bacterium]
MSRYPTSREWLERSGLAGEITEHDRHLAWLVVEDDGRYAIHVVVTRHNFVVEALVGGMTCASVKTSVSRVRGAIDEARAWLREYAAKNAKRGPGVQSVVEAINAPGFVPAGGGRS